MTPLCMANTQSLKKIYIEWANSVVIGEDLSWVIKLKKEERNLTTMELIVVQSKNRVSQMKVESMISQKYKLRSNTLIHRKK